MNMEWTAVLVRIARVLICVSIAVLAGLAVLVAGGYPI